MCGCAGMWLSGCVGECVRVRGYVVVWVGVCVCVCECVCYAFDIQTLENINNGKTKHALNLT